jgi:RNA polymerase sigma-70 factor (ECF subfamily)
VQEEQSLTHRARQGDKEAFAQLYENYFDKIYRYVVLKIGKADAEDVTQQVFIKALQAIASFKWKGVPFSAWLFRIAHNQVVDYLRKEKKMVKVPLNESSSRSDSDPQQMAERSLDIEQLISATQQLTRAQREVIGLRFAGELSIAEVAKTMNKSEGAVKALQHSAIVSLRKTMSRNENNEPG